MKKIITYQISIFDMKMLIAINSPYEEIKKWINKNSCKDLKNIFNNHINKEEWTNNYNYNSAVHKIEGKKNYYILEIKNIKDSWDDWEFLIHEIIHLKQFIFENKGIIEETEFESYFVQNTFREIRCLIINNYINKLYKKGKK